MKEHSENFWYRLEIRNAAPYSEFITAFLSECGSVGLHEQDDYIHAYFPADSDMNWVRAECRKFFVRLKQELGLGAAFNLSVSKIAVENWQKNWMQYFKPIQIAGKMVVQPSWEKVPETEEKIILTIDPEQAFGTGGHATTYLMLEILLEHGWPGMRVLDVGTGSGILAIAAAKMDSRSCLAFDVDLTAVKTAKKNSGLNNVSQVSFFCGTISAIRSNVVPFDFILANISSGVLNNLLPRLVGLLKNGNSLLALSGILIEEQKIIENLISDFDLKIKKVERKDEWLGVLCQKRFDF